MKRVALLLVAASALASGQTKLPIETAADRKPKTVTHGNCLIKHGRVYTISGKPTEDTDVLIRNGKIAQVGHGLTAPEGFVTLDATGKLVLPGIIDAHSHRGETESNEFTDSAVPEVQIRDALDPESLGLWQDLANGITSALLLHGSSDAIGGQSIVVKHKYNGTPEEMVFDGAPRMVKFALGENVTNKNDGNPTRFPISRMGVEAVYRRAFADAQAYMRLWDEYRSNVSKVGATEAAKRFGPPPRRDLRLEALADILKGNIWVHCHSYRQDEMLMMARLSQEFGFKLGALTHALEGYKIAPELAAAHIPVSMFSEAWAYKLEVYDSIPMGSALCMRAGVLTSVNTDTFNGIAPLEIDAGKMLRYGVSEEDALRAITINPAKQLGIDKRVGSLDIGKDGDVSIWSGNPLSVFAKCQTTLIDGEVVFERRDAFGVDAHSTIKSEVRPNPLDSDKLAPLPSAEVYAIVGGTVHPVSGGDIANGVVVLEGRKIKAVGGSTTPIPSNAVRVNATGLHVYPGFVDGGSDLGLNEMGEVRQSTDNSENGPFQPDLRAIVAVNPETAKIPIARCAGVTTAHITGGGGLVSGWTAVADLGGYNREQMSLNDKSAMLVNWPEGPNPAFISFIPADQVQKQKDSAKDQIAAIRDLFNAGKRAADAGDLTDPRMAAVAACVRNEKPVLFAVNSASGIKAVLAFAKDLGLKAIISGGADAWKVADQLAAAKVPVLYNAPTISCPGSTAAYSDNDPYDAPWATGYLLKKAGVKFAISTGDASNIQDLPNRAGWMCAYGLSPKDAIRAITLDAAEILGVGDKVGSLDSGKLANVIVTDGDPLELTTQVKRVFIEGKPIPLVSKFTQLYRKYEARLGGK